MSASMRDRLVTVLVTTAITFLAARTWDDVRVSQQLALLDARLSRVETELSQITRTVVVSPVPLVARPQP